MMPIAYQRLDVFADDDAAGNPAVVVLDADRLGTAEMQEAARRFGVSDTAFVRRCGSAHCVRWFTPSREIDLCGHATLAAAAALEADGPLSFGYANGTLEVTAEYVGGEAVYWLGRPAPTLHDPAGRLEAVLAALGSPAVDDLPPLVSSDADLLLPLPLSDDVERLVPDQLALSEACGQLGVRGVMAFAAGVDRHDVRARFFAPLYGIAEDPGTGSTHAAVAVYLYRHELLACFPEELRALSRQGPPAGPQCTLWLRLLAADGVPRRVEVGGRVVRRESGSLTL